MATIPGTDFETEEQRRKRANDLAKIGVQPPQSASPLTDINPPAPQNRVQTLAASPSPTPAAPQATPAAMPSPSPSASLPDFSSLDAIARNGATFGPQVQTQQYIQALQQLRASNPNLNASSFQSWLNANPGARNAVNSVFPQQAPSPQPSPLPPPAQPQGQPPAQPQVSNADYTNMVTNWLYKGQRDPRLDALQQSDPTAYWNVVKQGAQANLYLPGQADFQKQKYQDTINQANTELAKLDTQNQIAKQKADQEAAYGKTRADILASLPGIESNFNANAMATQQDAFKRLSPLAEARLNALGILQSGALPEAQAKIMGDLDRARSSRINDFDLNARSMADLQLPVDQLHGGIDLGLAGMNRGFSLDDVAAEEQFQMQLQYQALAMARQQREEQRRQGLLSSGLGITGAALGGYLGGPTGAMMGYGAGSQLGAYL